MKFPFHVTLLTLILGLLLATGTAIGVTSYLNTRRTVEDLSQQVLGHATMRIDQRINHLLLAAIEQNDLHRELMESGRISEKDFPRFVYDSIQMMRQHRWFTALGFTLNESGNGWYVKRDEDGSLTVVEGRWNSQTGKLALKSYAASNYPQGPSQTNFFPSDARHRPVFVQAKEARKPVWSDTYMMLNHDGEPDIPGLAYSLPVYREGGLLGVLSTTFSLRNLCEFLKDISIGDDGLPFIVEIKSDHTLSVIAHPDPSILLQTVSESGKSYTRLVDAEAIHDPRVRAFLGELKRKHPNLLPSELKDKSEAALRTLTQIRFTLDKVQYWGTYRCLSTDLTPDWLICTAVPETSILGKVEEGNRRTMYLLLGISIIAVLVSLLVSLQVARPLRRLAGQTEAIGQFHLAAEPVPPSFVTEVDRLAIAMENMKMSLRSFRKYVPADVVRSLLAAGQDAVLGGERRTVTIYFSDIADFTSISEQLTPEQLVTQLGEYFGGQSDEILSTGGTVDKYIGDAIMAFWGAPTPTPLHAMAACTAALRNQQLLRAMRAKWKTEGKPLFTTRIGLNTGEVIVGNIGSAARLNYTVIGDPVNLASRLEGLNKYYGTEILISESTYLEVKEGVVARPLDWVSVKGKRTGILVYELLGLKGEVSKDSEELVRIYTLALASYRAQDWTRAIELLEQVAKLQPEDQPTHQMLGRCRDYLGKPPGEGWDGIHHMDAK